MPNVPCGFDRADGLPGTDPFTSLSITRPGTITKPDQIKVTSAGGAGLANLPIEEVEDSPEIERAEQATFTHRHRMSWEEAKTQIAWLYRGQVRRDSDGHIYKILSAKIQHGKPGQALLTIVEEARDFDSPPDQFSITPVELGMHILKHPRYLYAFLGEGYGSPTEQKNQMVIRLLQDYFENTTAAYRNALAKMLLDSLTKTNGAGPQPPTGKMNTETGEWEWNTWGDDHSTPYVAGTNAAKRAALEIVMKYWRGEETPSIVGWEITWSQFYFIPQPLNPGGYIEDPILAAVPQLPPYFWSTIFPASSDPADGTIFDDMSYLNPQAYSKTGEGGGGTIISWRREADQYEYERTWFKITRKWTGSPVGFWDTELYSQMDRPDPNGNGDEYLIYQPETIAI